MLNFLDIDSSLLIICKNIADSHAFTRMIFITVEYLQSFCYCVRAPACTNEPMEPDRIEYLRLVTCLINLNNF